MNQQWDWGQLAALLTVVTICGSVFTWVVSALIDKKMARLKDEILAENTVKRGFTAG